MRVGGADPVDPAGFQESTKNFIGLCCWAGKPGMKNFREQEVP
jgi:hypothetical protein